MTVRVMPSFRRMDRELIAAIAHTKRKRIAGELVVEAVITLTGFSFDELCGSNQARLVTYARHLAMYGLQEHARMTIAAIGRTFGGRDHATVIAGIRRIQLERTWCEQTQNDVRRMASACETQEAT